MANDLRLAQLERDEMFRENRKIVRYAQQEIQRYENSRMSEAEARDYQLSNLMKQTDFLKAGGCFLARLICVFL